MLSILIPVYNQDVRKLANDLMKSATQAGIIYEIRFYDDASRPEIKALNKSLSEVEGIMYKELDNNIGRSRIRNLLARDALYDKLLFLDCDSGLPDHDFISRYTKYVEHSIVYGGRIYTEKCPGDEYALHWLYGSKVESQDTKKRRSEPYRYFHSNNFMVDKDLMIRHAFDEDLIGYGYEDIALGESLKKAHIEILHINNPVVHLELDKSQAFLDKTKKSLMNLHRMQHQGLISSTKLTRSYDSLNKLGVMSRLVGLGSTMESHIIDNLLSPKPTLKFFQYWKLIQYAQITQD